MTTTTNIKSNTAATIIVTITTTTAINSETITTTLWQDRVHHKNKIMQLRPFLENANVDFKVPTLPKYTR